MPPATGSPTFAKTIGIVGDSSFHLPAQSSGFGFGLVFIPLSIICFATLSVEFRVDGDSHVAAMY